MSAKISERFAIRSYERTGTAATDIAWIDGAGLARFGVKCSATALTGVGVTVFKILGNSASDGSGTDVVLATHAVGSAPDAVNDQLYLEVSKDQIVALSQSGARYLSANVTQANAADQTCVTYVAEHELQKSGLTGDIVA